MAETYVECLVKKKVPGYSYLVKSIMIALIVVSLFIAMLGSFLVFALTVLLVVGAIFLFPTFNKEYEYIFMGDELQIDEIQNQSRRKVKGKFLMSRVEKVAMKNSAEIRPFLQNPNSKFKVIDYTTNNGDAGVYAMIYSDEKGKSIILFEPSERLIAAMKYQSPRKVITEC